MRPAFSEDLGRRASSRNVSVDTYVLGTYGILR
jgi:hypothetical protein